LVDLESIDLLDYADGRAENFRVLRGWALKTRRQCPSPSFTSSYIRCWIASNGWPDANFVSLRRNLGDIVAAADDGRDKDASRTPC
jgi:hypothetical protein